MYCGNKPEGYLSIVSRNMDITSGEDEIDIVVFKVTSNDVIFELLSKEVNRFWETIDKGRMYRVATATKQEMKWQLLTSFEKVL
jgi:hypothetical protein